MSLMKSGRARFHSVGGMGLVTTLFTRVFRKGRHSLSSEAMGSCFGSSSWAKDVPLEVQVIETWSLRHDHGQGRVTAS
jgi:hypothetical protein